MTRIVQMARSKRWIIGLVVLLGVAAFGAWWTYRPVKEKWDLPVIDRSSLDEEVAVAIDAAMKNVETSPQSAEAWGSLGKILATHRFTDEAVVCFSRAEKVDPKDARWPYFAG